MGMEEKEIVRSKGDTRMCQTRLLEDRYLVQWDSKKAE